MSQALCPPSLPPLHWKSACSTPLPALCRQGFEGRGGLAVRAAVLSSLLPNERYAVQTCRARVPPAPGTGCESSALPRDPRGSQAVKTQITALVRARQSLPAAVTNTKPLGTGLPASAALGEPQKGHRWNPCPGKGSAEEIWAPSLGFPTAATAGRRGPRAAAPRATRRKGKA